jgi:NTP pyrophosphatase (non-canonical NTP hydrolase)
MEKDKLDIIFEKQKSFEEQLGVPVDYLQHIALKAYKKPLVEDDEIKTITRWTEKFITAISNELEEIRICFPWKWWKKNQTMDLKHAKEELIDVFHFIIALAIILGLDSDNLLKSYMDKMQENLKRQKNNY